jgi:hypothetical protein
MFVLVGTKAWEYFFGLDAFVKILEGSNYVLFVT